MVIFICGLGFGYRANLKWRRFFSPWPTLNSSQSADPSSFSSSHSQSSWSLSIHPNFLRVQSETLSEADEDFSTSRATNARHWRTQRWIYFPTTRSILPTIRLVNSTEHALCTGPCLLLLLLLFRMRNRDYSSPSSSSSNSLPPPSLIVLLLLILTFFLFSSSFIFDFAPCSFHPSILTLPQLYPSSISFVTMTRIVPPRVLNRYIHYFTLFRFSHLWLYLLFSLFIQLRFNVNSRTCLSKLFSVLVYLL